MSINTKIWLAHNNTKHGPYDENVVREWLAEGSLPTDTLAWREGMKAWISVHQLPLPKLASVATGVASEVAGKSNAQPCSVSEKPEPLGPFGQAARETVSTIRSSLSGSLANKIGDDEDHVDDAADKSSFRIVITGKALAGFEAKSVWDKSADLFDVSRKTFQKKILDLSPVIITNTDDEKSATKMLAKLVAIGVEAHLYSGDGPGWKYLHEKRILGPVPMKFLKEAHASGQLLRGTRISKEGTNSWVNIEDELEGDLASSRKTHEPSRRRGEPLESSLLNPVTDSVANQFSWGNEKHRRGAISFLVILVASLAGIFYVLDGKSPERWSGPSGASGRAKSGQAHGDAAKAKAIYSSGGDAALSLVKEFAVGTWTSSGIPGHLWYRFVIGTNGGITFQMAMPAANGWGEETRGVIVPITDKFQDTGERWYGFKMEDTALSFLIGTDGTLRYYDPDEVGLRLSHNDAWPFSK